MKKIIIGIPIAMFSALVLLMAWVNLAPQETIFVTKTTAEAAAVEGNARENIATAWNHWNGNALDEANIDKEITFIALKSIDSREMIDLGMAKEFAKLQEVANSISGDFGRLTDDEKQIYYKEFGDILYEIHNSINLNKGT